MARTARRLLFEIDMALTPEEIARQNAARIRGGEIGEIGARAKPTISVNTAGVASVGSPDVGAAPVDQYVKGRMASERAARIDAVRTGGVEALDRTLDAQARGAAPSGARPAPASLDIGGAPSAAQRAGAAARPVANAASRATRLGASPVKTRSPSGVGSIRAAPGQGAAGAALVALPAADAALDSANRSTEDYYRRLMLDPGLANQGGVVGTARDIGVRTAGVMTDVGAGILDMGTGVVNRVRQIGGAPPIRSFSSIVQGNDNPDAMAELDRQTAVESGAAPPRNSYAARPATAGSAQELPTMTVRGRDIGEPAPAAQSDVLGEFNGRKITRAEADSLANRNVMSSAPLGKGVAMSMLTGGRVTPDFGEATPRAATAPQQADPAAQERADRLEARNASNDRLAKLYKRFDSLMGDGKRRSAAVVAELIGRELGVVEGTSRGSGSGRQSASDIAEAGRLNAVTEGLQYENSRKRMADEALAAYMEAPDTPEGKRALTQYQSIMGKQYKDYKPIVITAADGSQRVVSFDSTSGTAAASGNDIGRLSQAEAAIAAGADPEKVRKRLEGSR